MACARSSRTLSSPVNVLMLKRPSSVIVILRAWSSDGSWLPVSISINWTIWRCALSSWRGCVGMLTLLGLSREASPQAAAAIIIPRWRFRAGDALTPQNPSLYSSSIKAVVILPLTKRACSITADRKGILCPMPRMVNASSAVCIRPMAALRSLPHVHSFAIIGS